MRAAPASQAEADLSGDASLAPLAAADGDAVRVSFKQAGDAFLRPVGSKSMVTTR